VTSERIVRHYCIDCGTEVKGGFQAFCAQCGGMVDVEYALKEVDFPHSTNPYVRFAGLLPVGALRGRLPEMSYTPMVHATRLGAELGMQSLYLKNETVLPTGTTKDRMAAVVLAYLFERGVRTFCISSTGNSSTSLAYGIGAHPDMHLFVFTAERFVPRVHYAVQPQVTHFGMRDATFVEAAEFSAVYARRHGLTSEGGFFNPGRREGLKLAFLEACDQIERPIDWYVQAVSSAMGVYGTYKGAKELFQLGRISRLPRLLCVQQESCAPMVRAFDDGSDQIRPEHLVPRPTGIAEAILRGDPTRAYPHVRQIVMESAGGFTSVNEAEIREARRKIEDLEGLTPCFSAAAAVAGLSKRVRSGDLHRSAVVVVNLTGSDRPDAQAASEVCWIDKSSDGWVAAPPGSFMVRANEFDSPIPSAASAP
jgi:threonine synthase